MDEQYRAFSADLPEAAIQKAATKAFKGYDTTGYGYQWCVDRLNEIVGPDGWRESVEDVHCERGDKMWSVVKKITIELGHWDFGNWVPRASHFCYGGHDSKFLGDAHKGAYSSGLKKVLALYGIGSSAYRGTLDDDLTFIPENVHDLPESEKSMAEIIEKQIISAVDRIELVGIGKSLKGNKTLTPRVANYLRKIYDSRIKSFKVEDVP